MNFKCLKMKDLTTIFLSIIPDVASGGSDDWAKGGAGIPFSYTVEMRDEGTFGFQLPARYKLMSCPCFIKYRFFKNQLLLVRL